MSVGPGDSLYFGPPGREALAWLHRSEQPASVGLVLCSSFGREDLCLHRSVRHFAASAAARGIPALRFDYPGSGDSAGSEFAPGLVDQWLASIGDAVSTLKQQTGVKSVCLLGIRLGALLAAQVAASRSDIAGLVAIAPVTAGRLYVREMKAYSLAASSFGANVPTEGNGDLLEAGGFAMGLETQDALRRIDLMKDVFAPSYPTLIVDRDDLPPDHRWLERLRGLGANVQSIAVPGYAGMVRDSTPHHAEVPTQMIDAVMSWVGQLARSGLPAQAASDAVRVTSKLEWSAGSATGLIETVANIDVGARLTALVTSPAPLSANTSPARAIVLLSGGADRRIGPGRLFVHLAREWAAKGFVVLRLDLSGIGDSQPRPGAAENIPYLPQALDDIDAAVRYLREHHRVGHCQLVGLCAGAYNGFRAAVAGTAVDAVVMINPLLYLSVGDAPVDMGERQSVVVDSIRGYRRNISSWSRWRTLLTDPQKVLRVLGNMAGMVRDKSHRRLRDGLRLLGVPLHNDLPSEMLKLAKQNTQLRFVFSPDEHGESLLWSLGGATVKRLMQARKISITASKGADHLYTLLEDRQELFSTLTLLIDPQATVESAPDSLSHPASLSVSKGMA